LKRLLLLVAALALLVIHREAREGV
jgi:hypothetical protein